MSSIAPKLHKCWTHKIKNAKAAKFLLQSAFYTSKRSICKVAPTQSSLLNPYLDWGKGAKWPLRVFAKYLKIGLADLHETL